jgi:hypothetical protein
MAAAEAIPLEFVRTYHRVPVSVPLPCTHAVRGDEPVLLESNEQISRWFPSLAECLGSVGDALAVLPLHLDRRVIGALALTFPGRRAFEDSEVTLLGLVGALCSETVGRILLAESLRESEVERDQLRRIVDGFDQGVLVVSGDLRVDLANAAASRMLAGGSLGTGDSLPEPWPHFSLRHYVTSLLSSESSCAPRCERVAVDGVPHEIVAIRDRSSAIVLLRAIQSHEGQNPAKCSIVEEVANELKVPVETLAATGTVLNRLARALMGAADRRLDGGGEWPVAQPLPQGARGDGLVRKVGGVEIDLVGHDVSVEGAPVHLTPSEFKLLALLSGEPKRVFTRQEIIEHLWDSRYIADGHACDTHISNLRRKIEADPSRPERLVSVRGAGYKLVPA